MDYLQTVRKKMWQRGSKGVHYIHDNMIILCVLLVFVSL